MIMHLEFEDRMVIETSTFNNTMTNIHCKRPPLGNFSKVSNWRRVQLTADKN